jgi:uncharacterized glyoxalase superfamily protein PhnB
MSDLRKGSAVIPGLRYKDAPAAIDWLVRVLGFTAQAVYDGPDGTVAHAQLVHGTTGMVMLGSAGNASPHPELQAVPEEIGGRSTTSLYLVVEDCDPVWERVKAEGAKVLMELKTMDYGGRGFGVVDPEGYMWSVGEYDPWK